MPAKQKASTKPGGYREKLSKMDQGPEEISKDATTLNLPWKVPYRPSDQKTVLANGGSDTLTVEDLTNFKNPTRLAAFAKDQCPNLERLTLHFQISRWDSNEEVAEEIVGIWGSCILLPEECKFSIKAEYVTFDVEGPNTEDEEKRNSRARTTIMKYFDKFAAQKGRTIEFADD